MLLEDPRSLNGLFSSHSPSVEQPSSPFFCFPACQCIRFCIQSILSSVTEDKALADPIVCIAIQGRGHLFSVDSGTWHFTILLNVPPELCTGIACRAVVAKLLWKTPHLSHSLIGQKILINLLRMGIQTWVKVALVCRCCCVGCR